MYAPLDGEAGRSNALQKPIMFSSPSGSKKTSLNKIEEL